MTIKDAGLKFTGPLYLRSKTENIVIHHDAGPCASIEDVHRIFLNKGSFGTGYNFWIDRDGVIWVGRGFDKVGAHAGAKGSAARYNNSRSIGICLAAYAHSPKNIVPNEAQLQACAELIQDCMRRYPGIKTIKRHKEMPGCQTACPGDYFPWDKLMAKVHNTDVLKPSKRLLKYQKPYMKGQDVAYVQEQLNQRNRAGLVVDGIYGRKTKTAVLAYQKKVFTDRREWDGIVGPNTWAKL